MPSWLRLDADFPDNPRIASVSNDAALLYIVLACHCAQHDTDGRVSATQTRRLARTKRAQSATRWVGELVRVGLVVRDGQDYILPGYLERNPSRDEVERRRGIWREQKRAWRIASDVRGGHEEVSAGESAHNASYRFASRGSTTNNAHLVGLEPVDNSEPHARERLSEEELAAARATIKERRR